ncbi:MAG: SDR family oxidoreductase [Dehalococcoidia bacterium]
MRGGAVGRLEGKVAVITGAASGIGEATARAFAREGAALVLGDVQEEKLAEVVRSLRQNADSECVALATDVTSSEDVQALVRTATERFGKLDVIYNNAGIGGRERSVIACPEATFDRIIAVNLKGVWLGIKHAAAYMSENGGGSIICTASVAGITGLAGQAAYNSSKAGVIATVKTAAGELASHGIRVNCICPGAIVTGLTSHWIGSEEAAREQLGRFHPLGRAGEPEDIANAALWLASDESSFVTGQAIVVDGGWTSVDARWQDTVFAPPQ